MKRWKGLLLILACLSYIGCATLLTDREYILINRPVDGKVTFHGEIYGHSVVKPNALALGYKTANTLISPRKI